MPIVRTDNIIFCPISPSHCQNRKIFLHNPSVASRQLPLHKGALAAYRADNAFFYPEDSHESSARWFVMTALFGVRSPLQNPICRTAERYRAGQVGNENRPRSSRLGCRPCRQIPIFHSAALSRYAYSKIPFIRGFFFYFFQQFFFVFKK